MKVNNITIVGGGTSAWLAAAYLSRTQPDIEITVIDKEIGNPIGVGEATLLTFDSFLKECGFEVKDWFTEIDAGYKSGILFSNWKNAGDDIWHPFYKGNRLVRGKYRVWDLWSRHQDLDFKTYATGFYNSTVLENTVDGNNLESFAYHVDCGKLVVFLQNKLKNRVKFIASDVINVVNKESGDIDYIKLKDGNEVRSDLYIDCTGFRNVLRKPKEYVPLMGRLFVDTAVVCPVPYQDREKEFTPYATADAVDHGWIWRIGVNSRIGSGMVFNKSITDVDEAKDYFVNYWQGRIKKEDIRVIDWTPFYNKDLWVGNVVTIGLGAGFIEPLESTGIGLITYAVGSISNVLRGRHYTAEDCQLFNLSMTAVVDDAVDFVSAHYVNNDRDTKFWNWVRETFKPSEKMLHYIEELSNPNVSVPNEVKHYLMFGGSNWALLLIQLGYAVSPRNLDVIDELTREGLLANYIEHEKHRHVWSRAHSKEVDRLRELLTQL
tara:strand:+ start:7114 stop:8586 length:1473 start_codon:yes stop_codon:yes gene_type:complete